MSHCTKGLDWADGPRKIRSSEKSNNAYFSKLTVEFPLCTNGFATDRKFNFRGYKNTTDRFPSFLKY